MPHIAAVASAVPYLLHLSELGMVTSFLSGIVVSDAASRIIDGGPFQPLAFASEASHALWLINSERPVIVASIFDNGTFAGASTAKFP